MCSSRAAGDAAGGEGVDVKMLAEQNLQLKEALKRLHTHSITEKSEVLECNSASGVLVYSRPKSRYPRAFLNLLVPRSRRAVDGVSSCVRVCGCWCASTFAKAEFCDPLRNCTGSNTHSVSRVCVFRRCCCIRQLTKTVRTLEKEAALHATLQEDVGKLQAWKKAKTAEMKDLMEQVFFPL